jgi:hypothetical protein
MARRLPASRGLLPEGDCRDCEDIDACGAVGRLSRLPHRRTVAPLGPAVKRLSRTSAGFGFLPTYDVLHDH